MDALRAELPPQNSTEHPSSYEPNTFLVEWFDQRFSVLDRNFDAIIRTHLRDGSVAAWHENVAKAFEEIGEVDLAIEWAQHATMFSLGHQSQSAARRWLRLLGEYRRDSLPDAAQVVFERWPTSENAARLVETVGEGVRGRRNVINQRTRYPRLPPRGSMEPHPPGQLVPVPVRCRLRAQVVATLPARHRILRLVTPPV